MEIITGVERRRHWRPEEKLRIVAEAERPGVSFVAVARRHQVSRGLLWTWRNQVRRGDLAPEPMPVFLPVQVTPDPPLALAPSSPAPVPASASVQPRDTRVEITLPDGTCVRVGADVGLVGLGHVAVDGTKLRANASKHKAMSYARIVRAKAELEAEVQAWLDRAAAADAAEDAEHGPDRRGDEMPDWVADKKRRLERIRAARAELEAQAQAQARAAAKAAARPDPGSKADGTPAKRRGPKPAQPPGTPEPSAQRNFTDPDSRIMLGRDGFVQAYNDQAAVDADNQVIVAHRLTANASDQDGLLPLVDATAANTGRPPAEISADNGFCSETNLAGLVERKVRGYVATGRAKHPADNTGRGGGPQTAAMRRRIRQGGHRSRYRLRKHVVEPVFGQIKAARGFRQLLFRGIEKVRHEWALLCTVHNLVKLTS